MNTYNGYENRETWETMMYINLISNDISSLYNTVYNMIENRINKDIIHTYIYSQLETDIIEHNIPISLDKVSLNDIYNNIKCDVQYNERINLVKNIGLE